MTKKYFNELNYSLGNEDTTFEYLLTRSLRPKKILSIAGSGGRAFPMLHEGVSDLYLVDVSTEQLYLCELRESTMRSLGFQDWMRFWGYPPYGQGDYSHRRKEIFESLELSSAARTYFVSLFNSLNWGSILYEGKWEKTFMALSKVLRTVMGKNYDEIFNHYDLPSQLRFYENDFPMKTWRFILFVLGNKAVFNALLYKGDFIKKNSPETHFEYYFNAFDRLFRTRLARESFFIHLCFHGEINHEDGNPIEARENVFNEMKAALGHGAKIHYENRDLISTTNSLNGAGLDFLSLSDVPSYFSGDLERDFLSLIKPALSPGAIVVLRYYLRSAEVNESGYEDVSMRYTEESARELVQMYNIRVLEFLG